MIAIDFETANYDATSACAVGFSYVDGGSIVTESYLIRPPTLQFHYRFISIHHITPAMVAGVLTFAELWEKISSLIVGQQLCAHNARFDKSVLDALVHHYRLPVVQPYTFLCTMCLARQSLPHLGNHKLPTVAQHLGIALKHHDAGSDAEACLRIAHHFTGESASPLGN